MRYDIVWGKSNDHEEEKDEDSDEQVYTVGSNTVCFSTGVSDTSIERLIKISRELIYAPNADKYRLVINSYGGSVVAMFRFIDFYETEIKPRITYTESIVHGMAASAGAFIAMAFDNRYITPRSTIMLHEIIAFNFGIMTHLESQMKFLNSCMGHIFDVYRKVFTTKSDDEIKQMLLKESWLGAKEAEELGLAKIMSST